MSKFITIIILSALPFVLLSSEPILTRCVITVILFLLLFLFSRWTAHIRKDQAWSILLGSFGSILGLGAGHLLSPSILFFLKNPSSTFPFTLLMMLVCGYVSFVIFHDNAHKIGFFLNRGTEDKEDNVNFHKYKIVDTSAIIDARILDISPSGFLEGIFIIPKFVLRELQLISDSADAMKRQRGRRGMDVVNKMQKSKDLIVQIMDKDYPEIRGVDMKLIALAKEINGAIVTTDFNLHKIAEIDSVKIFNINKLAETMKPILAPGEHFEILIVKQGKDQNQGVGYLEDGTMVVVENGSKFINKKRRVEVTSVIQTESGRMIFAK
jgi:uncharacterized protein YacL